MVACNNKIRANISKGVCQPHFVPEFFEPYRGPSQWGIELILGPYMVHLGNFGMEADICIHNKFWPKRTFLNSIF